MGCDDYPLIGGRYQITGPVLAVQWNAELAARFPDADHDRCTQSMTYSGGEWFPHSPPLCHGYHCPECGRACGSNGHQDCAVAR